MIWLAAAAAIVRLSPEAAEAARAEGEARALAMYAREDAAARKKHEGRGLLGLGVGTRELSRAHAPLGDTGGADFVYPPGSLGRSRYRDN